VICLFVNKVKYYLGTSSKCGDSISLAWGCMWNKWAEVSKCWNC